MNTTKISSYGKLITFFLVIVILLSIFVIAAGGWQIKDDDPDDNTDLPSGDDHVTDNDQIKDDGDVTDDNNTSTEPEQPEQKYYDYLTGTEISESVTLNRQLAYVIDSNSPLCGISECSMLIEVPTENSSTRFLMLANRSLNYNKVGSISYSRKYIDNIAAAFGATVVSLGNDDTIDYDCVRCEFNSIELMKNPGAYYNEYTYFYYTSPSLFNRYASDNYVAKQASLPYTFADIGEKVKVGSIVASTVTLPYAKATSLVFSSDNNKYVLTKSYSDRIDVNSSEKVSFDNAFILFADSMTYETATSTEMVLSTLGSGKGYYMQSGYAEEITWSLSESGEMLFYNSNGTKLNVNRGSSYVAFVKSSNMSSVSFS